MNVAAWIAELEEDKRVLEGTVKDADGRIGDIEKALGALALLVPRDPLVVPALPPPAKVKRGNGPLPQLTPERVLEVMRERGEGWLAAGDFFPHLGVSGKTATRRLEELIGDGRVEKQCRLSATRYRNKPAVLPNAGAPSAAASATKRPPAPPALPAEEPASLRPEGEVLRNKIELILMDSRPRTIKELSDNLVVPKHDIETEINELLRRGEMMVGPAVKKAGGLDAIATYEIEKDVAGEWA